MCGAPSLFLPLSIIISFFFSCSQLIHLTLSFCSLFWSCIVQILFGSLPTLSESSCPPLCGLELIFRLLYWACVPAVGMLGAGVISAQKLGPSAVLVRRIMACSLLCNFVMYPRIGLPWASWEYMLSPFTMVVGKDALWWDHFCLQHRASSFCCSPIDQPRCSLFRFQLIPSSRRTVMNVFKPVNLYPKIALLKGFT